MYLLRAYSFISSESYWMINLRTFLTHVIHGGFEQVERVSDVELELLLRHMWFYISVRQYLFSSCHRLDSLACYDSQTMAGGPFIAGPLSRQDSTVQKCAVMHLSESGIRTRDSRIPAVRDRCRPTPRIQRHCR
jgi:hypothetical protein